MEAMRLDNDAAAVPNEPKRDHGEAGGDADDFVDPWSVHTTSEKGIDYDKLISKSVSISVDQRGAADADADDVILILSLRIWLRVHAIALQNGSVARSSTRS